jgi:hypothetical protein
LPASNRRPTDGDGSASCGDQSVGQAACGGHEYFSLIAGTNRDYLNNLHFVFEDSENHSDADSSEFEFFAVFQVAAQGFADFVGAYS